MKTSSQSTITTSEETLRKIIREEVREELRNYPTRLELEKVKTELDDNARNYRDEIMNKMDKVIGSIEQVREDHEKRLTKLEQP